MPTLEINGQRVEVDDGFLKLSPDQQNATVDEIAKSMGTSAGAQNAPGLLERGYNAVKSAVTGEGRMDDPNLPEFRPHGATASEAAKLAAGRMFGDKEQQADIVRNALPGAEVTQDSHGNYIVDWNGQRGYINKPGIGPLDIASAAGQGGLYAATLASGGELGFLPRMGLRALLGAGTSAATDAALIPAGSKQGISPIKAAVTGAGVAGGEALAAGGSVAYRALSRLLGKGVPVIDGQTGQLTQQAASALHEAGVDPRDITPSLIDQLTNSATKLGGVTPAAARTAVAGEFGVPLTRGQATGDVTQTAFEEAARNNAKGSAAGDLMRGFDQRQQQAVANARQNIGEQLAGGQSVANDALEAGERVREGIRSQAAAHNAAIDQAYDAARPAMENTVVSADAFRALPGRIQNALSNSDIVVDDLTPATRAALKSIQDFSQFREANLGPGDKVAGVSLRGVEQLRRRINNRFDQVANPTDRRALRIAKNELDNWIDDSVDSSLMSGDPAAIDAIKNARQLRANYQFRFGKRNPKDTAGGMIDRIINTDATDGEVANWLFGASKVGMKGESVRLASRLKDVLGADSPEWAAIRQAAWLRAVEKPGTPVDQLGPQAVANRINDFLSGDGRNLAQVLYTPEELSQGRRFALTLRHLIPPKEATNPSRSSYGVARLMGNWLGNMTGVTGFATGHPMAGLAAREGVNIGLGLKSALKAITAAKGAPKVIPPTSSLLPAAGGIAGQRLLPAN